MKALITITLVYLSITTLGVWMATTTDGTGRGVEIGPHHPTGIGTAAQPFGKGKNRCAVQPPPDGEICPDPCQFFHERSCRCKEIPRCSP